MKKVKVSCAAKLNLALNVFEKSGKFHPIDSVVTSVGLYDSVTVTERKDRFVTVNEIEGINPATNTAYKAALLFSDAFGTNGADIVLKKNIPVATGMGGSSADICAVLHALSLLYGKFTDKIYRVAEILGSDTVFMMQGGLARITGRGQYVEQVCCPCKLHFAVTFFDKQISAADAYAAFDSAGGEHTDIDALVHCLAEGNTQCAISLTGNSLQKTIGRGYCDGYLEFCALNGVKTCMTGSGSAFFAMFSTQSDAMKFVRLLNDNGFNSLYLSSVEKKDAIIL